MIEAIILIVCFFIALGLLFYFIGKKSRGQKKIERMFKDVNQKIEKYKDDERKAGQEAMEKLREETDPVKARKRAYYIASRFFREFGLEGLEYLERNFGDELTEEDHKDIKFLRSRTIYTMVLLGKRDTHLLDQARDLLFDLLRDDEYCGDPHKKLRVQEYLRHVAVEKQIIKGDGSP
jgi:hypothetical protein